MQPDADSAQVRFPPPLALLTSIAFAMALQVALPRPFFTGWTQFLGAPLMAAALAIVIYCNFLFKHEETSIAPWRPSTKLLTGSLYASSRNPIYASFLLFNLGLAMLSDNAWLLATTAVLAFWLRYGVIAKEERYLESKFGGEYLAYKARVRRWL